VDQSPIRPLVRKGGQRIGGLVGDGGNAPLDSDHGCHESFVVGSLADDHRIAAGSEVDDFEVHSLQGRYFDDKVGRHYAF
jgi:hypothetical protein